MAFHNVPPNGFPDLPDMEEMEAVVKDVTNLKTSVSDLTEDAEDLASGIAPEFSAESAYTADDIVWHEGALYVFTSDHAAGAWSTDDTQALTVGGEITTLSGNVSDLNSGKANQITIAPFFNPEAEYEAGDLVYYNGLTYRCTNDHQGAWDAADFAATTIANELDTLKSGLTNLVKVYHANGTTDAVGDFTFNVPSNGTLLYVRPMRDAEYYNSWWGVILASKIGNVGHSAKAIKDDNTALVSQAVKFDVYYI